MNQDYDFQFKVLITGSTCVGKSNILLRFSENIFHESFLPTIGVDFKIKNLNVNNKQVKLHIWDTAGQERFKTITAAYYKGAHGIMLVYDITDRQSFNEVEMWQNESDKNGGPGLTKLLIGNKCDKNNERKIPVSEGQAFAESRGMSFIETSALSKINIEEAFRIISTELLKKNNHLIPNNDGNLNSIHMKRKEQKKVSCCRN